MVTGHSGSESEMYIYMQLNRRTTSPRVPVECILEMEGSQIV